jgi:hypothetical protein
MIYSDGIHLISDTSLEELHAFAEKIGLKRGWLHHTPGRPHYDLVTEDIRQRARDAGAKFVGRRELIAAIRRNPLYAEWQTERARRRNRANRSVRE